MKAVMPAMVPQFKPPAGMRGLAAMPWHEENFLFHLVWLRLLLMSLPLPLLMQIPAFYGATLVGWVPA